MKWWHGIVREWQHPMLVNFFIAPIITVFILAVSHDVLSTIHVGSTSQRS
jgi:hypothetical protein